MAFSMELESRSRTNKRKPPVLVDIVAQGISMRKIFRAQMFKIESCCWYTDIRIGFKKGLTDSADNDYIYHVTLILSMFMMLLLGIYNHIPSA